MKQKLLVLSFGVGAMLLATQHAFAQQSRSCGPRERVIERLTTTYGETRQSFGLGSNNVLVETYASDANGSWTIIATLPNGTTCLVASGQSFENRADQNRAKGQDA
ncbi:MAG: hypothetical protein ACSHXD_14610 [Marinosulfonomonas sp.]